MNLPAGGGVRGGARPAPFRRASGWHKPSPAHDLQLVGRGAAGVAAPPEGIVESAPDTKGPRGRDEVISVMLIERALPGTYEADHAIPGLVRLHRLHRSYRQMRECVDNKG